jgi:hypothetical protein
MRKIIGLALAVVIAMAASCAPAFAQQGSLAYRVVVASCSGITWPAAGKLAPAYVDTSGNPCPGPQAGVLPAGSNVIGKVGIDQSSPGSSNGVEITGASFVNITTATTTTAKSGAGILHKVCINTYVASGSVTIYNNTAGSGAKIGTILNPATLVAEGPNCAVYDAAFSIGLTVVTVGAQDVTVTYR